MIVKLVDDPNALPSNDILNFNSGQCDCDCDCACITGETIEPLELPISYYLELTPLCNNHCPTCGNVFKIYAPKQKPPLTGEGWITVLEKIKGSARQLKLSGGEVTLHKDFYEIVSYIEQLGISFVILSNGLWQKPDPLLKFLSSKTKFGGFLISLHGPDAETHGKFVGSTGVFDKTVDNIEKAAAESSVATSFVINKYNYLKVEETYKFAIDKGVDHIVCNRLIGAQQSDLAVTEGQLKQTIDDIEALIAKGARIRYGNCIPQCFQKTKSRGCLAGKTFVTIDPWGNIRPCNHSPVVVDRLTPKKDIAQIWTSEPMQNWRNQETKECLVCSYYPICGGGCRVECNLNETKSDPLFRGVINDPIPQDVIYLHKELRPHGIFKVLEESHQTILEIGNAYTRVPTSLLSLPQHLNGNLTLEEINTMMGQDALNWVGELNEGGFVEMI